jgi:hypothetical protein
MAEKSKVKKPRWLSETRIDNAISDFQETLGDFCAAMLSNGSRNGREWVVPDLDNSPRHDAKPGSCCVNLETGCFYDHNPAAEPQNGGPVQLWTALSESPISWRSSSEWKLGSKTAPCRTGPEG